MKKLAISMLGLCFTFLSFSKTEKGSKTIINGQLDLSKWNFRTEGIVKLNGQWEFYWHQLLSPQDFNEFHKSNTRQYLSVPGLFTELKSNNPIKENTGYGTYRLVIKLPEKGKVYCLKTLRIMTASKIWINNLLVEQAGSVQKGPLNSKAKIFPNEYAFYADTTQLEIIIQISNYHHSKGGIIDPIKFGTFEQINASHIKSSGFDLFICGVLVIMACYHVGLFYLRRKEKSAFFFGILCFFTASHLIVNGEIILLDFFPNIPWEIFQRINFLCSYSRALFLSLFIYQLFPDEIAKKRFIVPVIIWFILITLPVLMLPARLFTKTLNVFLLGSLLVLVYLMIGIVKALVHKRKGAWLSFICMSVILLTSLNDMLHDRMIIQTTYLIPFGLFVFVFGQAYMLSLRFASAFSQTEALTIELNDMNQDLEHRVEERTAVIEAQNYELHQKTENLQKQNDVILLQKEEIERKNKNITSSINYAKRIQQAILPEGEYINQYMNEAFVIYKPRDIVSGDFYWLKCIPTEQGTRVFVAVADCTGHGVPGAFMSMLGISFLNDIVQRNENINANEILEELRIRIKTTLQQRGTENEAKDGMDIAFCIIDTYSLEIQYAGANLPLLMVCAGETAETERNENECMEFRPTHNPIGIYLKEIPFKNNLIKAQKGDMIYLATDGFIDQVGGEKGRKFLHRRFKELLVTISTLEARQQENRINSVLSGWMMDGKYEQIDDILVMGIRV